MLVIAHIIDNVLKHCLKFYLRLTTKSSEWSILILNFSFKLWPHGLSNS